MNVMVFVKCAYPFWGVTADREQRKGGKKEKTMESGCLVYDFLQSSAASCYVTATTATPQRKVTHCFVRQERNTVLFLSLKDLVIVKHGTCFKVNLIVVFKFFSATGFEPKLKMLSFLADKWNVYKSCCLYPGIMVYNLFTCMYVYYWICQITCIVSITQLNYSNILKPA